MGLQIPVLLEKPLWGHNEAFSHVYHVLLGKVLKQAVPVPHVLLGEALLAEGLALIVNRALIALEV
jgi:hypothetical protein